MRKDQPGRFFYRMVDTVLARDKNWVYWKMAGCEPIRRDPVTPEVWADAQASAQRATTNKRLRPVPLNAVSMEFLKEKEREKVMEELRDPERYKVPDLDSFKAKIADDDFEISMASNEQAKAKAIGSKASKSWRALRIARDFKLAAFDKIDDPNDISAIFEPLDDIEAEDNDAAAGEEDMPTNRETVVISGPPGVGKSTLVDKLLEAHKGVFGRVVRHTTREPAEGEANGKSFHFVKALEFNQLRDGDRLVEYTEQGDVAYGTSSKAIDTVAESGKVPVIELDMEVKSYPVWGVFYFTADQLFQAAKFAKDMMDFPARYILIKPPTPESLEARLKNAGDRDDSAIKSIIDGLTEQLDESKTSELYHSMIVNDDLEQAIKTISEFLYKKDGEEEQKQEDEVPTAEEGLNGGEQMEVDGKIES